MKSVFNIVVSFILIGLLFMISCKKEVVPTIAEVRVVTEEGEMIPYADVLLTCTSSVNLPCEVEIIGKSDKNGVFTYEFELPKCIRGYRSR